MITQEIKDQVLLSSQILLGENNGENLYRRINLMFSNRMTSSMGIAQVKGSYVPKAGYNITVNKLFYQYNLKLSTPLFERASDSECHDTVVHEVCHLVDHLINGKMDGHGYNWKQYMIKCGVKPEVYHTVNNAGLRAKPKRYDIACGCKKIFRVSKRKLNQIINESRTCYYCREKFISLS